MGCCCASDKKQDNIHSDDDINTNTKDLLSDYRGNEKNDDNADYLSTAQSPQLMTANYNKHETKTDIIIQSTCNLNDIPSTLSSSISFSHKKYSLLLINGYIRNFETKYKQIIIPSDIIIILLKYIYLNEHFNYIPNGVISSNHNKTITMQCHVENRSIFGDICIESKSEEICKWTIKVNKMIGYMMVIGISSEWTSNDDCFTDNTVSSNYGYQGIGRKWSQNKSEKYGGGYRDGDIIEMILNLKKATLKYYINGKNDGIQFTKIKMSQHVNYKMAVSMFWENQSVTIVKFEDLLLFS